MSSVIFANFFENGDGLLTVDVDHHKPNNDRHDSMKIKLFRLLLTQSGHYLLPSFYNMPNHPVSSRVLPTLTDYDEHDIIMTDDEVLEKIEKEERKDVKVSHASIWLGLVAFGSYSTKALLAATMVQAASAYETADEKAHNYIKDDEKPQAETFIGDSMIFITVIFAINLEKMIKYVCGKIHGKEKRFLSVKDESSEGATPMDVDQSNLDLMEVDEDVAFEIRKLRKRL